MAGSVLHLMTMMLLLGIPGSTGQAQLGPLASCAGDVSTSGPLATCILQATNISAINVDIPAVADCLEEYRNSLSASCVSALEQFVVQEGRDGDLDREVADQETTESESQIEAEDEICDARLMQVCRTELIAATFTGSTTRLTDCAQRHLTEVGQACVAMAVHASSDGLLAHMRRCGFKAIEYCPAQALALSAAAAAGFDNIDLTSILSLGSCLRDHAQQMRQGCMGFIDSVADVVATLSSQASDRFNDEESNVQDPTSAPTPPAPPNTPATPPATLPPNPPSDGTDGHTGDQTTHHKGKGSSTDPPRGGTSASDSKGGEDDTSSDHSNGLGAGSIALISIAVVAVVVGGVLGAIFFVRRRRMSAGLAEVMGLAQSGSTGVPSQLDAEVGFLHKKSAYERLEMA